MTAKHALLEDLALARDELECHLAARVRGSAGPGTVAQLCARLEWASLIDDQLRHDKVPPQPVRVSQSRAWILVDGWDPADPLASRLLNLASIYCRVPGYLIEHAQEYPLEPAPSSPDAALAAAARFAAGELAVIGYRRDDAHDELVDRSHFLRAARWPHAEVTSAATRWRDVVALLARLVTDLLRDEPSAVRSLFVFDELAWRRLPATPLDAAWK